jgi:glycosyltransferase involved in cell wall biosynthesis
MTYADDAPPEIVDRRQGLTYASVDESVYFQSSYIQDRYAEFQPEAVIFAHGSASFADWILNTDVPVWIDFCGHVMTEAQAKAAVYLDDSFLDYFFSRILGALFRGDAFSSVSEAQRWALVGELGLAGRLNSCTNGVDLVHTIPCGVEEQDYTHDRTVLRGVDVGEDAFVVLWSGGFNTWTDVDTMFEGLVYAMDRDPTVRFVATGGQIDGHDEKTYPRFEEMIENSPHRDRFVLKGWLPRDLVHNYYFEADVGINCEKDIYEVRLGSKHRILDWSRAALPVISTRVTELSFAVEEDGVGFVCDPANPEALGCAILKAVARRSELASIGERFRNSMRQRYGFSLTTQPLRDWARNPRVIGDRESDDTCLKALVNKETPSVESAVSVGDDPAENDHSQSAPPDTGAVHGVDEPPFDISRYHWLLRVVKKSYSDGGIGMVIRRAWLRLTGRKNRAADQ